LRHNDIPFCFFRYYSQVFYFFLFSLSFIKESREKKKVTKKKREKENFIKLLFMV